MTTPLTPAQLEASLVAEAASIVSVLDLFVKYEVQLEAWIPGISQFVPFVNRIDAGLKAFLAASVTA